MRGRWHDAHERCHEHVHEHMHGHDGHEPRGWYRRRRRRRGLRAQMFKAFGVAIGATALAVGLVTWLLGGGAGWRKDADRAERFLAHRFEDAWSDPAARAALARSLAEDMHMAVRTRDGHGHVLDAIGELDGCRKRKELPMLDGGTVELCYDGHAGFGFSPWRAPFLVLVPGMVLWMLAGLWSRRLTRPLAELTAVARDLGDGKLERRARLRHGLSGEVGELTTAINDMAGRLEEKIRAERELLAGVSHELRTPLARVRVLTEMGREGATGTRDVWSEIEVEVGEMDALVGELLASARVDFRALSLRPLDAADVARQAATRHGGGVRVEAPDPSPIVDADATLLARALGALLDNARKHAGGATLVRIVPRAGGAFVAFEIEDAGAGFAAQDLPRAFEPFYRGAGQAHDEARGVGLGLALVRRIAEVHGGRALVENLPSGGTRATLELRGHSPSSN